jgi:hypothetical protein
MNQSQVGNENRRNLSFTVITLATIGRRELEPTQNSINKMNSCMLLLSFSITSQGSSTGKVTVIVREDRLLYVIP